MRIPKLTTNQTHNNMKQLLLSLTMLLCVGNAFGQTTAKLIEKYKAVPGAVYENTT